MVGKKQTPAAPTWFGIEAYSSAKTLDVGDWLLNLTLRRWLHDEPNPQTEDALRKAGPVLSRKDAAQMKAMHLADCHQWVHSFNSSDWGVDTIGAHQEAIRRPALPLDVLDALKVGSVRRGVRPLGLAEMYAFERRLPDAVRKAGATFSSNDRPGLHPREFSGTLDDAFGPAPSHQMTGRFLRVDLTLPDDVLHADLAHYLATERLRLHKMGGPQPYREAARLKLKPHRGSLQAFAEDGLLPFLDLDRWQRSAGRHLSFYALREMAKVPKPRESGLRERVKLAQDQMRLHAWFARLERSVKATARERQSTK